jgi:transposase
LTAFREDDYLRPSLRRGLTPMMGQLPPAQPELFYEFCLDRHVPADHLLRQIEAVLDLDGLRRHLAPYYSAVGRPSIDPELMIRMLLVGYCFGIRSERRLCEEVHLNLAYRWFCKLGLDGAVPDHSTFSKNRHGRFRESEVFRYVFETVVRSCMAAGLVKGEGFATDASIVRADASRFKAFPGDQIDWTDPKLGTRAVREYLAGLDETEQAEDRDRKMSVVDPAATWTAATVGAAFFGYCTNYLVDVQVGIILGVEASTVNKAGEVEATQRMIEQVEDRFGLKPDRLIGDTNYGSAAMLAWLVDEKGIAPHVPVCDKTERHDGTFSVSDFTWNEVANEYRCPAGQPLRLNWRPYKQPRTHLTKAGTLIYRASKLACAACALKAHCCPNMAARKIARSIHEKARDVARRLATTEAYRQSQHHRKKVEMLFAHLKRILKLDRLRLRGFTGANDEFTLAATAQNLRRLARLSAQPPPDIDGIAAPSFG